MNFRKRYAALIGLALGIACLCAGGVRAEIFTVFSDNGFPPSTDPNVEIRFGGGAATTFDDHAADVAAPEGFTSFKTTLAGPGFAGWGFATGTSTPENLSRFQTGELRFWVYSSTGDIEVGIKKDGVTPLYLKTLTVAGLWNWSTMHDRWVLIRIPLAGLNLSAVEFPCLFTAVSGPATFYIDNVRYVDATTGSPSFKLSIKNRSDNSDALQINWPTVNLPAGWLMADQYLNLEVDGNALAWGVQIYTDNTAAEATPRFTGVPSQTDPSGLVDSLTPTQRLPMAWTIHSDTVTFPAQAANPNVNGTWFFMQDKATPAFFNGFAYATALTNQGIHFSSNDPFGSLRVPPNPIYLEADFANAASQRSYATSTLRVEFFTP
jgi:hypothetical protein